MLYAAPGGFEFGLFLLSALGCTSVPVYNTRYRESRLVAGYRLPSISSRTVWLRQRNQAESPAASVTRATAASSSSTTASWLIQYRSPRSLLYHYTTPQLPHATTSTRGIARKSNKSDARTAAVDEKNLKNVLRVLITLVKIRRFSAPPFRCPARTWVEHAVLSCLRLRWWCRRRDHSTAAAAAAATVSRDR